MAFSEFKAAFESKFGRILVCQSYGPRHEKSHEVWFDRNGVEPVIGDWRGFMLYSNQDILTSWAWTGPGVNFQFIADIGNIAKNLDRLRDVPPRPPKRVLLPLPRREIAAVLHRFACVLENGLY
jgi:hypothetical protein